MKLTIALLALCVLIAAPALCETSVWIARTDSSVMYIGGTIHMLRESDYPFPLEFDRAYDASSIVVLEADIAALADPQTQQALFAGSAYPEDTTLDMVLSDEAYAVLGEYCTENGLDTAQLKHYKPWMISLVLLGLAGQKLGTTGVGVDAYYLDRAVSDQKLTQWLETVEYQIEMMSSMGEGNESAFMIYNINQLRKLDELFEQLVSSWKAGDEEALIELMLTEVIQDFPKLYKTMFTDRNMNWLPKMEAYLLTPETEFVLVGVGHLVGEDGVIARLKKLGYAVEKLTAE